jgi:NAD(P)-dependent dehydrogenase (short-subunit alcohol dehydrogenase family)
MEQKTILLIGASGGVGQKIAVDFLEAGYCLAFHYHEQASGAAALIEKYGNDRVKSYQADITQEAEVVQLIEAVKADFSSIDILVNNAGITRNGMSWKLSEADWQQTIGVNLTGPFLTMKQVLPGMRENGWGRIINITSVVAQTGYPGTAAYAASKAGLIGVTKTIAKEVANKDITVNAIALGYFDAGMLYEVPEELRTEIQASIPKNKFGDTAELSKCILYLCDEKSSYLTGQTLNLNGGLY